MNTLSDRRTNEFQCWHGACLGRSFFETRNHYFDWRMWDQSSRSYFSLSNESSNCSNSAWLAAIVFAGPANLMNTFPPGPSTIAPSRR